MLNIQEVVNFLNEALNVDEKITFNIRAEVGESDNESLINGILRTAQAKTTPIADYTENRYSFVCELGVPTGRSNKVFIKAQDIVSQFDNSYNGKKIDFSNGSATINISLGKPENFKVVYNVGECTPLYFSMDMIYTESGVMSIQKKWYLSEDGTNFYEIPYESESVVLNKEGITRKVDFDKYTKTFLTGQTKFYKFKFPYQNTDLGNMLMKDILNGDFKKQYTLKYVDGINYINNDLIKPAFTSKVSIFMSGDVNSQVVNVGKFDITFTDVDDGNTTVKYYIGLFDWKFDLSGEDTRYFATQNEQRTYFNTIITGSGQTGWQQIKAPNLDSIFVTNQIFPNVTGMNIFDIARKNYAIIRVITGTLANPTTDKWIIYGIVNCQIGADGQVSLDLEEDTVQTFLPDSSLVLDNCFIERAHSNRWFTTDYNYFYYDFSKNSALFEREPMQGMSKKTSKKERLKVLVDTSRSNNDAFNILYNEWVDHWVYVFMDEGSYITLDSSGGETMGSLKYKRGVATGNEGNFDIDSSLAVFCFPVYKKATIIGTTPSFVLYGTRPSSGGNDEYLLCDEGWQAFIEANGGYTSKVKAIKRSIIPPFSGDLSGKYTYDTKSLTLSSSITGPMAIRSKILTVDNQQLTTAGILHKVSQNLEPITLYSDTDFYDYKFTWRDVTTETIKEPKLFNEDYATYNIYFGGQTYQMPVSKTSPKPVFKYYEMLTPDITKFYLAFDSQNTETINPYTINSVFTSDNTKDFTGLVGTLDLSMWYSNSSLDQWLVENKNNLQIFQNQQKLASDKDNLKLGMGLFTAGAHGAMAGTAAGIVSANPAVGIASAVVGTATGIANTVANRITSEWDRKVERINRDLTLDNMRQAPETLSAVNSNGIFLIAVDTLGVYIELQTLIPFEETQINDFLKKNGYTLNVIDNVRTYLNYRINWNYVKAIIGNIYGVPMNIMEKNNLKTRFENGIRFWAQDNINYSLLNYERYLLGD